jgi:hypothetical protein
MPEMQKTQQCEVDGAVGLHRKVMRGRIQAALTVRRSVVA